MLSNSSDLSTEGTEFFTICGEVIGCKGPVSVPSPPAVCAMKQKHLLTKDFSNTKAKERKIV